MSVGLSEMNEEVIHLTDKIPLPPERLLNGEILVWSAFTHWLFAVKNSILIHQFRLHKCQETIRQARLFCHLFMEMIVFKIFKQGEAEGTGYFTIQWWKQMSKLPASVKMNCLEHSALYFGDKWGRYSYFDYFEWLVLSVHEMRRQVFSWISTLG